MLWESLSLITREDLITSVFQWMFVGWPASNYFVNEVCLLVWVWNAQTEVSFKTYIGLFHQFYSQRLYYSSHVSNWLYGDVLSKIVLSLFPENQASSRFLSRKMYLDRHVNRCKQNGNGKLWRNEDGTFIWSKQMGTLYNVWHEFKKKWFPF